MLIAWVIAPYASKSQLIVWVSWLNALVMKAS